jgi:hypothetical protein
VALIITASLHPHIRYVIRRIAKPRLILAIILGIVSIAPLAYAIYLDNAVAMRIFGVPSAPIDIGANVVSVGQDLFGFFSTSNSHLLRPMFSLATVLLVLIGIYRLLTVKYTARSYTAIILGVIVSIAIIINPRYAYNLFPIIVLMVAMGVATLIIDWYKLFPRNPYARIAGLIPLAVLVVGLSFSDVTRYTSSYLYSPDILASYSYDLRLLSKTLAKQPKNTKVLLITTQKERSFYDLVAYYDKRFIVTTEYDTADRPVAIVSHEAYQANMPPWQLTQIITNRKATDADRFYLYKTSAK